MTTKSDPDPHPDPHPEPRTRTRTPRRRRWRRLVLAVLGLGTVWSLSPWSLYPRAAVTIDHCDQHALIAAQQTIAQRQAEAHPARLMREPVYAELGEAILDACRFTPYHLREFIERDTRARDAARERGPDPTPSPRPDWLERWQARADYSHYCADASLPDELAVMPSHERAAAMRRRCGLSGPAFPLRYTLLYHYLTQAGVSAAVSDQVVTWMSSAPAAIPIDAPATLRRLPAAACGLSVVDGVAVRLTADAIVVPTYPARDPIHDGEVTAVADLVRRELEHEYEDPNDGSIVLVADADVPVRVVLGLTDAVGYGAEVTFVASVATERPSSRVRPSSLPLATDHAEPTHRLRIDPDGAELRALGAPSALAAGASSGALLEPLRALRPPGDALEHDAPHVQIVVSDHAFTVADLSAVLGALAHPACGVMPDADRVLVEREDITDAVRWSVVSREPVAPEDSPARPASGPNTP